MEFVADVSAFEWLLVAVTAFVGGCSAVAGFVALAGYLAGRNRR